MKRFEDYLAEENIRVSKPTGREGTVILRRDVFPKMLNDLAEALEKLEKKFATHTHCYGYGENAENDATTTFPCAHPKQP